MSPLQAQMIPLLYSTQAKSTTLKKLRLGLNYHKVSGAYLQSDLMHFRTHILNREKKVRGLDLRKSFNLTAAGFWETMKMTERIIEATKKVIITHYHFAGKVSFCGQ